MSYVDDEWRAEAVRRRRLAQLIFVSVFALIVLLLLSCSHQEPRPAVSGVVPPAHIEVLSVGTSTTVTSTTTTTTTTTTQPPQAPVTSVPVSATTSPSTTQQTATQGAHVPAWAHGVPGAGRVPGIMWRIAGCEGAIHPAVHDPWTEWNHGGSGASGPWQDMPGTWDGYGGYAHAAHAPPSVQIEFNLSLYARRGMQPWEASEWCWA